MAIRYFCDGCKEEVTYRSAMTSMTKGKDDGHDAKCYGEFCSSCIYKIEIAIHELAIREKSKDEVPF